MKAVPAGVGAHEARWPPMVPSDNLAPTGRAVLGRVRVFAAMRAGLQPLEESDGE